LLLAAGPLYLWYFGDKSLLIPQFWFMFSFVATLTLLAITGILAAQSVSPELGTQAFMAATVIKLLACLVFVLVFILKQKVNRPVFMADFFYLYFLNTGFEIYVLLRNLRNQNLK
jgi:hypothetical protein